VLQIGTTSSVITLDVNLQEILARLDGRELLNESDRDGETVLHVAATNGNVAIFEVRLFLIYWQK